MSNYVIELFKTTDEYGADEWTATVVPPLNDWGPYTNWPSVASVLSAIASDIDPEGHPDV